MSDFQGDLLIYSTEDGGEIQLNDENLFVADHGFDSAIYLSLFGGNYKDNGSESKKKYEYWGNKLEKNNPERKLTSRTQNVITGLPAVPSNINKVRAAMNEDLSWMVNTGIVDTIDIILTIPKRNWLHAEISGIKDKKKIFGTAYEQLWLAKIS